MERNAASSLVAFVERLRASKPQYDWQPVVEEPSGWIERKLSPCPAPEIVRGTAGLDATRRMLREVIREYLEIKVPDHILLIRSLPGSGKTQAAVEIIDELVAQGRRVAYAGPRHDFFADVLAKTNLPEQWYEWLPRQAGDDDQVQTCRYAAQISEWLGKGYEAMDFCAGVCGWDYVNNGCPYHAQKRRAEAVIYVQHQHVALGHPLQFDVLIGDESPISAFLHEWRIPARWVCPPGMDPTDPLTEILHLLSALVQATPRAIEGPELLEALGGTGYVHEACDAWSMPADALASGSIHYADAVDSAPYFHLPALAVLLERESASAVAGAAYPHRIIAAAGHLTLLLRRKPDLEHLPQHIVWLDATGQAEIYQRLFGRRVEQVDASPHLQGRIYQVVDRANGKNAIDPAPLVRKEPGQTANSRQAEQLIRRIIEDRGYQNPSLISYKGFTSKTEIPIRRSHFYAARGTNEHEDADAIFILGAPQANIYDVVKIAKMIYFETGQAFDVRWCVRQQPYAYVAPDGQGRCYPVSGFWNDSALQRVLEMIREDEIIQAAHRARPVNHAVDIWLLTNVPIASLPPDELLTMREVMDAPLGVNIWKWGGVQELMQRQDTITVADLVNLGLNYETARQYLAVIGNLEGWQPSVTKSRRGKPTLTVVHNRGLLNN